MAKVKFVNRVKYNGAWYPAHTSFEVADEDVQKLVEKGAIITEAPVNNKSLDEMKADELVAYAADKGIDIAGLTKKADIKAAIEAAIKAAEVSE